MPAFGDLPHGVISDVLAHCSVQDALHRPNKRALAAIVACAPPEWQAEFTAVYVDPVRDIAGPGFGIEIGRARDFLVPAHAVQEVVRKTRKRRNVIDVDKMCAWLLAQHGSTTRWRACQIHDLQKRNRWNEWSADAIETTFPEVLRELSKCLFALDLHEVARRMGTLSAEVQAAILGGRASAAALDRARMYVATGESDATAVATHVAHGDIVMAQLEWNGVASELLERVETPESLRSRFPAAGTSPHGPERVRRLLRAFGCCTMISAEFHDDILAYIDGDDGDPDVPRSLRDRVTTESHDTLRRMVIRDLSHLDVDDDDFSDAQRWTVDFDYLDEFNPFDFQYFVGAVERFVLVKRRFGEHDVTIVSSDNLMRNGVRLSEVVEDCAGHMQVLSDYFRDREDDVEGVVNFFVEIFDRHRRLEEALHLEGLELRRDSRLCKEYVEDGRGTVAHVVAMMLEMEFFVKRTGYLEIVEKIRLRRGHHDRGGAVEESRWAKQVALSRAAIPEPGTSFSFDHDRRTLDAAVAAYEDLIATEVCYGRNMCADCRSGYDNESDDDSDNDSDMWDSDGSGRVRVRGPLC